MYQTKTCTDQSKTVPIKNHVYTRNTVNLKWNGWIKEKMARSNNGIFFFIVCGAVIAAKWIKNKWNKHFLQLLELKSDMRGLEQEINTIGTKKTCGFESKIQFDIH